MSSNTVTSRVLSDQRFGFVVRAFVYVALILHAFFVLAFYALDVTTLAAVNVGSVILYAVAIVIGRRGRIRAGFALSTFEVLAHSALAVLILGWGSGFQYYIFVMAILVFLYPSEYTPLKILVAAGMYLMYVILSLVSQVTPQPGLVSPTILRGFEAFNVSAFFVLIIFLTYLYNKAANQAETRLKSANETLSELARTDVVTGLSNRRAMLLRLEQELAAVEEGRRPFALVLADIDDFKMINDRLGHASGDEALRQTAAVLRSAVRDQDLVARWGGEEFLVLLPETQPEGAMLVAERMRSLIAGTTIRCDTATTVLTLTFGVSTHCPGTSLEECIVAADRALYEGKRLGKNRVIQSPTINPALPA